MRTSKNLPSNQTEEKLIAEVFNAIKSIKYGYVQIVIQNSKVVQIDKTEKIRLSEHNVETKGGIKA